MKKILVSISCFLITFSALAQPHIKGTMTIKMNDGLMDCDFKLSGLPELNDYTILLNHGMNIQYFTNEKDEVMTYDGYYNFSSKGEGIEYALTKPDETLLPLPSSFRIKYKGAFPVYKDKPNFFDFKGVIAFNGKTLRAAEQSKWYPVIYDAKNDRMIDNYTYEITVTIEGGKTVYINGSIPQQKTVSILKSTIARPLLLFAGDYDFVESNGNYLLNANVDGETAANIFKEIDRIKAFHAANLGITYKENIYIISHEPIEKYNKGRSWGFTTFPSFAYAGVDFRTLLNSQNKLTGSYLHFFAHELSHFYFGGNSMSGKQGWFWLESTTEYLALKASQKMTDTTFYNKRIRNYANRIKDKKYKPLGRIENGNEIDEDYRYVYGPLILMAFEKQFGEKKTYDILAEIVKKSTTETVTLETLKQSSLNKGIKPEEFDYFYKTYLDSDKSVENTSKAALEMIEP